MAQGTVLKESTEIGWLIFGSFGVVVLTLIGHAVFRDFSKTVKRAREYFKPGRDRRQKKRIMALLRRCPHKDLAHLAFSLAAWPRSGVPDSALPLARPPHYRWDLKTGAGSLESEDSDPSLSMDFFQRNTKANLIAILDAKLDDRSRLTLTWLERWLLSLEEGTDDRGQCHE